MKQKSTRSRPFVDDSGQSHSTAELRATAVTVERQDSGCAHNFSQIVIEHYSPVRFYLSRFVHCPQKIDDLAQEIFVIVFQSLGSFRQESSLQTWLFGIARNQALNFLRQEVRRNEKFERFREMRRAAFSYRQLRKQEGPPDDAGLAALRSCIALLPPKSHDLVEQFYFNKNSSVEISETLSTSDAAIRMRLKRIRGVLSKCIKAKTGNLF